MSRFVKRLNIEGQRSAIRSLCFLCLFASILGCTEHKETVASFSEPVYSRQYRQHSVTAIVTLSETNIPTSGKIQLMIDVHTPAGTEVVLPDPGTAIEPFNVANGYTEPVQTLPNGKQLHRKVWILTPGLPGDIEFQPLEIVAGRETLNTRPIAIHVESLLPGGIDSLEIKDIAEPLELLPEQEKKRRSLYTILGIVLISGLIPYLIYLVRKPKPIILALPHESAFQALENLPDDPVERIHELNRILRCYYEARFNIPILGKTVLELQPLLDTEIFQFLEQCKDLRFAHKVPEHFGEEAELFVRNYIEKTMEVPECD